MAKTEANTRQADAIRRVVESGGKKGVSVAMIEAGYSPKTAKNPKKLTESGAWKKLMEKHLSDKSLADVHKKLLNSNHIDQITFTPKLSDIEIRELLKGVNCEVKKILRSETVTFVWFWSPDNRARKDGLDMAYKLKGKYAPEKKFNLNLDISAEDRIKASEVLQDIFEPDVNYKPKLKDGTPKTTTAKSVQ